MEEYKAQKIIVATALNDSDKQLIQHGIKLAYVFKKELCLLYNSSSEKNKLQAKSQLLAYANRIKQELPHLSVSALVLAAAKKELPDILAENHEGVLIVVNAQSLKKWAPALTESPVPFVFVHPESNIMDYNRIVQPVDLRKENSDSALWCSYFGRFNSAEITMVAANDQTKEGKQNVAKNVVLSRKLFAKFNIGHKVYKGSKSSFRVAFEALEYALASDCNLFVLLGSSSITPLDYLIGLPERKIISKAGKLPVLVINPRRDNFILCD